MPVRDNGRPRDDRSEDGRARDGRSRADRARDDGRPRHVPLSAQFLATLAVAVAATLALVAIVLAQALNQPPPPPGTSPGGRPPPPPVDTAVIIATAIFVLAWIAVMLTYGRDVVLYRVGGVESSLRTLRDDLAQDRREELADLSRRIIALTEEFGERRETEGYLHGMRQANLGPGPGAPRPLRPVPPAD